MAWYGRYVCYLLLCLLPVCGAAGDEWGFLRINEKSISLSEFRCFYNETRSTLPPGRDSPEECLNLFIDKKLKVCEAESLGLDALLPGNELASYRRSLLKGYLICDINETCGYGGEKRETKILIQQIFKRLPQNMPAAGLNRADCLMDSLSRAIAANPAAVNFPGLVRDFSDDREEWAVGRLEFPEEFESVVFSMNRNEISKPFYTPMGIHIVKVIDILSVPADAEGDIPQSSVRAYLAHLKKEYGYRPYEDNIRNLYRSKKPSEPLFAIGGRVYTVSDFDRYAGANPGSLSKQFEGFVTKTILEYECGCLEARHPEVEYLVRTRYDDILITALDERIKEEAAEDKEGMNSYFLSNRKKYNWEQPRYKGMVLQCANKKQKKQAKRLVKNLPEEYWADIIRKYFNTGGKQPVKVEEGIFVKGDNRHVDKQAFGGGRAAPDPLYPHTLVMGKKIKGPENYLEVRDQLVADRRNELETSLLTRLRAKFGVEIDEEVLKTVNNDSSN